MKIFAHRGASADFPENTMAAFREAVRLQVDGIETDVQMTKDGELVLCHDEQLERTTNGRGWVGSYSYADLCTLSAGSWFGERFIQERIPRLRDLLELCAPSGCIVNLELKNYLVRYPGMEEKVLEEVSRFYSLDKVLISSFSHPSLVKIKSLEPKCRTGVLVCCELYQPDSYAAACKAEALHPDFMTVTPEYVELAHRAGLQVNVYTVDATEDILRMESLGVDVVMTNCPQRALHTLGR